MASFDEIVEAGRGGDNDLAHVEKGEIVIPKDLHSKELMEFLRKKFEENGTSIRRYTVGDEENSINPETGNPEFFGKFLKKIFKVAAPILGAALGGPLGAELGIGATAGGALGGGLGGLAGGGGLKGAALGAIGGGLAPNLGDIASGLGVGEAFNSVGDALGLGQIGTSLGFDTGAANAGGALSSPGALGTSTAQGALTGGSGVSGASGFGGAGDIASAIGKPSLDSSILDKLAMDVGANASSGVAAGAPSLASVASSPGSTGLLGFLKNNSNLLLPGAALASSALKSDQVPKGLNESVAQAGQTGQIGSELAGSLTSGKLPAGAESMVQQAINDGEASIRSKYAQMGMSGSTNEAQEIQSLHERAQGMRFQMANDATQTGLNALGSSNAIYQQIMNQQLQQDQQLQDAIAAMAGSFGNAAGTAKAA